MKQKTYRSFYEFEKDMFPNKYKKRIEENESKSKDLFSAVFLRR
ncbi:hypothetical protein [Methanimicrococcus hacksteinii]|nr:hypothetical protein [Methanimicrococcus sp. At1]